MDTFLEKNIYLAVLLVNEYTLFPLHNVFCYIAISEHEIFSKSWDIVSWRFTVHLYGENIKHESFNNKCNYSHFHSRTDVSWQLWNIVNFHFYWEVYSMRLTIYFSLLLRNISSMWLTKRKFKKWWSKWKQN